MINLLPDDHKSEIRAGRANVLLTRYLAVLSGAIVVLGGLVAGAYGVLNNSQLTAQADMDSNSTRMAQYSAVQTKAESFRSDLTTAKSILDQQVSYTKLIYKIADSIPSGVILNSLDLDPNTFGSSMTINANAKSFEDASKLKNAFASNSDVFSKVTLIQLSGSGGNTDGSGSTDSNYPTQVSISVVINKGALQ